MQTSDFDPIVSVALQEDMPDGDVTSESVISPDSVSQAYILVKESGVLAGLPVAARIFAHLDPTAIFRSMVSDGESISSGEKLATIQGRSIALLKGERTALNFLQRLSGIAALTRRFVQALEGTSAKLLDTRKTTPGLRMLEKYAVRMGGGENHRLNLSEMAMLKDNHIRLVGSISKAIIRIREKASARIRIEVETTNLKQVQEAVAGGADMIMLDNMALPQIQEAVDWVGGRIPLEVSGNVSLENIRKIAETGVDFISVGSLTHSAPALDISMEFE